MSEEISFGNWLRQKRRMLDLTQKDLANQVGCAEITVRRMEADAYRPSKDLAFVLFEKLGIPERERPYWVGFARGLTQYPNTHWFSTSGKKPTTNLPFSLSSFIGREIEQDDIANLLEKNRLVTLTGVGGIGKTRLSLQVASKLLNDFPDGIWFVEFAPISDSELVAQTVINTLGLIDQANRSPQKILTDYIQTKKMLLIFDNCEHLVQACAHLAEGLLHACPGLKILATSREALGIKGELVYLVPSLTVPDASYTKFEEILNYESVQLFLSYAQATLPGFTLTQENAAAVVQVCRQLDGIPLALELAAARVKQLRVEEIIARLDERFQLLSMGSRTAMPHHQTLEAMVDWSHDLLNETEQVLLRRLSVFSGGWTLEAAEGVCADRNKIDASDILDLLASLANKSLIIVERQQGVETRYSMLETIRQYMHEKLSDAGDLDLMRNRHLAYFVDLAERGEQQVHGSDQIEWMDRLEIEVDNFRTALSWGITERHIESALRLIDALSWTWHWRGYVSEIEKGYKRILLLPGIEEYPELYAKLLSRIGDHFRTEDVPYARHVLEESREIWLKLGNEGENGLARVLDIQGKIALYEDKEIEAAQSLFESSFKLYQKHGDDQGMAWLIHELGELAYVQEHYTEAEKKFMTSLAKFQALGDKSMVAYNYSNLGELMRVQGDYERAGDFWGQNLEVFRELQTPKGLAFSYHALASVSLRKGEYDKAQNLFEESLRLFKEFGEKNGVALCIAGLASISGMTENLERAACLFGAAEVLFENTSNLEPADQKDFDHYFHIVYDQIEESVFEKTRAEGRAMTMEQAIECALDKN